MRFPTRVFEQAFLTALVVFLLSLPVLGQGTAGRIIGTVIDQSGGVISAATVTVTDVQRGIARTLVTDQSGEYVAPSLLPGTYDEQRDDQ